MDRLGNGSGWRLFIGGLAIAAVAFLAVAYSINHKRASGKDHTTPPSADKTTAKKSRGPGKQLFVDNCGSCHTLLAAGSSGSGGPSLDGSKASAQQMLETIEEGGSGSGAMPKNLVTGKEAVQLSKFLASVTGGSTKLKATATNELVAMKPTVIKVPKKPRVQPGSTGKTTKGGKTTQPSSGGGGGGGAAGKQPFVDNCGSCHVLKAAGTTGTAGPALDGYKGDVLAAIKNGGKSGGMPKNLVTGKEAKEVADFIAGG